MESMKRRNYGADWVLFGFVIFRRRSLTQSRRDTRRDKIKSKNKKKRKKSVPHARIDIPRENREREREITLPIYLLPLFQVRSYLCLSFSFPFFFLSLSSCSSFFFFLFLPPAHLYFTSRSSPLCATWSSACPHSLLIDWFISLCSWLLQILFHLLALDFFFQP